MYCKGHEGAPSWPRGFKRIRHYGLLAAAAKTQRLALARLLLTNPQAREDAQAFMRRVAAIEVECCPHCKVGHWLVVEQLLADRHAKKWAKHCSRYNACGQPVYFVNVTGDEDYERRSFSPLMALGTTTIWWPARAHFATRLATLRMRSVEPIDVPPYL